MAFIKASVGANGVNNSEDVKVIQWLLNQAEAGYQFMTVLSQGFVEINGRMDASTQIAIEDFARMCDRLDKPRGTRLAPDKIKIRGIKIEPDNKYYEKLIFAVVHTIAPKQITTAADYNDPRIKQALDGRITFEQFQFILKQSKNQALTTLGKQMQKHAQDVRVKAFLDMIAWAEGTDNDVSDGQRTGYDVMMGGTIKNPRLMPNLYNHPGGVASGRYQAIPSTWREATRMLGLYDMTPESQEIFGVYAFHTKRPGLLDAIVQNRFADAIETGSLEWASFPNRAASTAAGGDVNTTPTSGLKYSSGAKKGQPQPAKSLNELQDKYEKSLKNY